LIGPIDTVIEVVHAIVNGTMDWQAASGKLESYSGVQDVE
jgi:glycyl-tRNA synthetase